MNLRQVRALAQILKENDLTALEFSVGEDKIKLERRETAVLPTVPSVGTAPSVPGAQPVPMQKEQNYRAIKSPMVGVFYSAPSPDAEPFVKEGSHVKKGDVLCIIEAMKLMNEVNAEQDGKILEVCVENGEVVEYGQTLFKIV